MNICIWCLALDIEVCDISGPWSLCVSDDITVSLLSTPLWLLMVFCSENCVRLYVCGRWCLVSLFHSLSNIHSHPAQSLNRPAMKHKADVFFVPNNQINQTAGSCTPWLHIIFWKEQIWKPIWFRTYWLHFYSLPIFNEKREIMGDVKPIERLDVLRLSVLMKFQTHLEWKQTNRTV